MSNPNISEGIKTAGAALSLIERIVGLFRRRTDKEKAADKRRRAADKRDAAKSALTLRGMTRKLDRAAALDREADLLDPQ